MRYALEGVRVIDLAQHLAGPGVSMYLADQGADVIKVEPRGQGDQSRRMGSTPFLGENSRSFMVLNRNKRSITVDMRTPQGKEIITRLVRGADVVVTNSRTRVSERLGIDYETLRSINPRIIYGSVSAYGTRGPYAEKGGFDRMTQGMSGAMYRKTPEGVPMTAGVWISDSSIPMLLSYGIMCALWAREKTGVGQKVETSLLQAAVAMQGGDLVLAEDDPAGPVEGGSASYGIFQCGDGVYINVGALQDDQFVRLCGVMDLEHLAQDPRFNDPARNQEFRAEAFPIIEEFFKLKPSSEWLDLLNAADVPCAPILERWQVFDEPQIVENEIIVRVQHPEAGRTRLMGPPVRLSEMPGEIRTPAPLLGQHTDEVLRELGYDAQEIDVLRAHEVV